MIDFSSIGDGFKWILWIFLAMGLIYFVQSFSSHVKKETTMYSKNITKGGEVYLCRTTHKFNEENLICEHIYPAVKMRKVAP